MPGGWQLKDALPDLVNLTEWTVAARYPGDWAEPTDEEARVAVKQARVVWISVTTELAEHGFTAKEAP